ncbi:MAG: MFS transporter [Armatimonadetes bacterium]|nr:MFS transporter [Armatimonadota bacterium]
MMAGLISYLAPNPTVMGVLSALNGLGRNLAPLAAAPVVDRFQRKRDILLLFWLITCAVWGMLTVYLWTPGATNRAVSVWVFAVCYTLFFLFLGATGVAQGALLGKIIPADMRGRSLAMGMSLSGVINVGAIFLVSQILRSSGIPEPRSYALSFSLTTLCFLLAGAAVLFVREPKSAESKRRFGLAGSLRYFVTLARENPNLARLMIVNVAVGVLGSMLQFYTAYWRKSGTMTPESLAIATVVQVFCQSLTSGVLGRVADRVGNRALICPLLWVEVLIPLAAWLLGGVEPFRAHWLWFMGVYALIGARFPLYQLLVNYLLEIVPQRDHAMALGAVNTVGLLTTPAPFLLGALAQVLGYPFVFCVGSVVGALGAWVAIGLQEVRVKKEPAFSTR